MLLNINLKELTSVFDFDRIKTGCPFDLSHTQASNLNVNLSSSLSIISWYNSDKHLLLHNSQLVITNEESKQQVDSVNHQKKKLDWVVPAPSLYKIPDSVWM